MMDSIADASLRRRVSGALAVISAGDYLNKYGAQLIERECLSKLEAGCRALVINFRETKLVNSIGVSILLGIIDAAEETGAQVVFAGANEQTAHLFELLGITQYVTLARDEHEARAQLEESSSNNSPNGH
jgi:anti-anti-sigma factor